MRPKWPCWTVDVVLASAIEGQGLEQIWEKIRLFEGVMKERGNLKALRANQAKAWMWSQIQDQLIDAFQASHPKKIKHMEEAVEIGATPPTAAARMLLQNFFKNSSK